MPLPSLLNRGQVLRLPLMLIKRIMKKNLLQKNISFNLSRKLAEISGQSIVEYSLLIGIVIAVGVVLSPMVKRGTQGMVKIVADEVGIQNQAEHQGDGGLISSDTKVDLDQAQTKDEWRSGTIHSVSTNYDEQTTTETISHSDLGKRDQ